jgi:hypothetical protein
MRKKWLLVVGAVILAAALATTAFAADPIKLVVNGREIKPDVPPQLINGRTMVPVRWVVEALNVNAVVKWEAETRSVIIYTYIPASDSLSRQITLLQDALASTTPGEAVEKWAKGVKERNGALQYAVLSPELKKQKLSDYEHVGWVTGGSSPWVKDFKILKETKINEGLREYEVQFFWVASDGFAETTVANLTVKQDGQNWYISQIFNGTGLTGQSKTEQFQKEIKDFLARQYKHYRVLETEVTLLSQKVNNSFGEAEFKTKVTTLLGCKTPAEWPTQKGKIKYLEENRQNLTPEQIRKVEKEIDFWNKELQEYIEKPSDANDFLKITAEFDKQGMLKKNTVKIYSQDPMGKYLPVEEKNNPMFKTAEELVKQGYEEMRELVGQ